MRRGPKRADPAPRLELDAIADGVAHGWAHDPAGREELAVLIGGERLTGWPRTVRRGDADEAVGEAGTAKGFAVPLDPVSTALALTAPARRAAAALAFGPHRVPIEPAAPAAPSRALSHWLADIWLADSGHLRMRTRGGVSAVTVAQIDGRLVRHEAACATREAIVTAPLARPLAPVLLALDTESGPLLAVIPFPSLLRGGLHAAEGLAAAGGPERLADYGFEIAQALCRRTEPRTLRLAADGGLGTEPLQRPAVRDFLATHARIATEPAPDTDALTIPPDCIPTLAALAGEGSGWIQVDPRPGGSAWLVRGGQAPALQALFGPPRLPPFANGGIGRPLAIRFRNTGDEGLERLLFPLSPETPLGPPEPFGIVIGPGQPNDSKRLLESLPPAATVVDAASGPVDLAALAAAGRPVLFADRLMIIHDLRAVAALQRMLAAPGIGTAGCMIVREIRPGDLVARERIRSVGLLPTHAAADQPWRPAIGPVCAADVTDRATYLVAANHPAFVMVRPEALAACVGEPAATGPAELLGLMAAISRAGWRHATTTWFSVFDRRPDEPFLPGAPVDGLGDPDALMLRRLW